MCIRDSINNILNSGELTENNTVEKADVDHSKKTVKIYNRVDAEKEHMGNRASHEEAKCIMEYLKVHGKHIPLSCLLYTSRCV